MNVGIAVRSLITISFMAAGTQGVTQELCPIGDISIPNAHNYFLEQFLHYSNENKDTTVPSPIAPKTINCLEEYNKILKVYKSEFSFLGSLRKSVNTNDVIDKASQLLKGEHALPDYIEKLEMINIDWYGCYSSSYPYSNRNAFRAYRDSKLRNDLDRYIGELKGQVRAESDANLRLIASENSLKEQKEYFSTIAPQLASAEDKLNASLVQGDIVKVLRSNADFQKMINTAKKDKAISYQFVDSYSEAVSPVVRRCRNLYMLMPGAWRQSNAALDKSTLSDWIQLAKNLTVGEVDEKMMEDVDKMICKNSEYLKALIDSDTGKFANKAPIPYINEKGKNYIITKRNIDLQLNELGVRISELEDKLINYGNIPGNYIDDEMRTVFQRWITDGHMKKLDTIVDAVNNVKTTKEVYSSQLNDLIEFDKQLLDEKAKVGERLLSIIQQRNIVLTCRALDPNAKYASSALAQQLDSLAKEERFQKNNLTYYELNRSEDFRSLVKAKISEIENLISVSGIPSKSWSNGRMISYFALNQTLLDYRQILK